jgi:opacity protein-like surface antigen
MAMTLVAAATLVGPSAWAQDPRVEIGGTAGWTFSDGVSGDARIIPTVGTFDRVDPKDAFSWGVRLGYMANPNVEIGALFSQQSTTLELSGSSTVELGDLNLRNYHGYVAYNFGDPDAVARPYVLGGLGATEFGSISASAGDQHKEIDGSTKFSSTWGAGLKINASPRFGLRLEGRWTPTYIKSDAVGWWCDPYWGCYVTESAQFSNQFELGGGVTIRF